MGSYDTHNKTIFIYERAAGVARLYWHGDLHVGVFGSQAAQCAHGSVGVFWFRYPTLRIVWLHARELGFSVKLVQNEVAP